MSPPRRALVALGGTIGIVLLALVATLAAARLHLELPVGRRAIGDAIERLVSSEIRGTLRIGHVDEVGLDRMLARDVEIRTPAEDGQEAEVVLRLDSVELDPDLGRLFAERRIATASGRVDGGLLRMTEGDDGLTIERALDPPSPGVGPPSFFIDFAGLHFEGLQTRWALQGAPSFRIDDVSGFTSIRTDEQGNVAMRFDRLAGELRTTGLPIEVSAGVRRASGRVHSGWERMGLFDIELDVAGSPLELELELIDRDGGIQVRAQMDADGPSIPWIAALGIDIATDIAGIEGIELEDDDDDAETK
ncbi:MAG: hypothetical protein M3Y87_01155 [Myxococcota bacterium]|nr:hypothetical protein [Myxococcota bacterium]